MIIKVNPATDKSIFTKILKERFEDLSSFFVDTVTLTPELIVEFTIHYTIKKITYDNDAVYVKLNKAVKVYEWETEICRLIARKLQYYSFNKVYVSFHSKFLGIINTNTEKYVVKNLTVEHLYDYGLM